MNQDHFAQLSKLGITITSFVTLSLLFINKAYYAGVFWASNVNTSLISIDMRDLLNPHKVIMEHGFIIAMGYLGAHELQKVRSPQGGRASVGVKVVTGFIFMFCLTSPVFLLFYGSLTNVYFSVFLVVLGIALYYVLEINDLVIKLMGIGLLAGTVMLTFFYEGYQTNKSQNTEATISMINGKIINSKYLYANSQTYFVIEKGKQEVLTCIPRSQIQEVSVFEIK